MSGQSNIAALLTSYAKPSRKVDDGVPAYGLTLGGFGNAAAGVTGGGSLTSHALTFALGLVAGTLLGVRVMNRR